MPVRLNTIPDAESYAAPPARIKWLSALLLMLSVGVAITSLFASDELAKNGPHFWGWPAVCLPLSGRWLLQFAGCFLSRSTFGLMPGISAGKR
ncbi:hypothetical protein D1505_08960 [Escherichia coli]|nr:hypothetical protein CHQ87_0005395 [Escherichia coli]RIJ73045.1 hypothetical protein D1505_08960 [Escherichia coli]RIX57315.1 hypothetical protein D3I61_16230 [Escherichia coli]